MDSLLFDQKFSTRQIGMCWNRRSRGINRRRRPLIGKSVSVSFRVRVVRASERARRSCVGVWEGSVCQRWGSPFQPEQVKTEVWLKKQLSLITQPWSPWQAGAGGSVFTILVFNNEARVSFFWHHPFICTRWVDFLGNIEIWRNVGFFLKSEWNKE